MRLVNLINELIEQYKDMPVATTQMLMLADFQGQVGWATSYGKTMLNPFMYASGRIINFA